MPGEWDGLKRHPTPLIEGVYGTTKQLAEKLLALNQNRLASNWQGLKPDSFYGLFLMDFFGPAEAVPLLQSVSEMSFCSL
jgi:hypothetical protein